MPKENEIVTVGVLREMFVENNKIIFKKFDQIDGRFERIESKMESEFAWIHEEFVRVHAKFDQIDAEFVWMHTEFARVHREIGDLRDDIVEIIDNSIVPQLEEHRRDISLLKRAVTTV